jgi:hypothetical protein
LKLPLAIACLSLVVPLFVLGLTAGNWRAALKAWGQYALVFLALAAFGIVAGIWMLIWPPHP